MNKDPKKFADEADDRDASPIELSEELLEHWDFEDDPDWR
jgi:hypothetical protein